jgi:hypothetical protein
LNRAAAAALAALLSLAAPFAPALELEESVRVASWSSSRDLDGHKGPIPVQLWLRSSDALPLGDAIVRLHGEAWMERQVNGASNRVRGRVREAYAQLSAGPMELRAGWQIFPWGRADAINPTDNLTPRQLTFLTRETEDQRFGSPALRVTWFSGPVSLNLLWLAGFKPTELPWPAGAPQLVDVKPSTPAAQWATRLEAVRSEFEGSLSYFDGYDVLPTQAVISAFAAPQVSVFHERLKIAGADFAKTIGRFGLRGEMAHMGSTHTERDAIFSKRAQWYVVAGGDRTFGEYLNVNLQYYYRYVDARAVPRDLTAAAESIGNAFAVTAQQYDRIDRGLTFRISNQWLNETVEASVSGLISTARHGRVIRPLIKYRAADAWTVSLGGEIFSGDDHSLYGFLHDNTTMYAELRWGF